MEIRATYLFLTYHLPSNHNGDAKDILQDILCFLSTNIPNIAYIQGKIKKYIEVNTLFFIIGLSKRGHFRKKA